MCGSIPATSGNPQQWKKGLLRAEFGKLKFIYDLPVQRYMIILEATATNKT